MCTRQQGSCKGQVRVPGQGQNLLRPRGRTTLNQLQLTRVVFYFLTI